MTSPKNLLPLLLAAILPAQERVTLTAADEVGLVADWYALEGDAPTLVFLPGAGGTRGAFDELAAALAKAGSTSSCPCATCCRRTRGRFACG